MSEHDHIDELLKSVKTGVESFYDETQKRTEDVISEVKEAVNKIEALAVERDFTFSELRTLSRVTAAAETYIKIMRDKLEEGKALRERLEGSR